MRTWETELTVGDRLMLAFARRGWRSPAAKHQAIRARFGCSPGAYYVRLARLIDEPAAWAADPATVKRLRARRDARLAA